METLAGYRVIRELGGGARSEVFLAHDADDRVVIARLLHADVPDSVAARSIAAARSVECDGVLPLVDAATTPEGRVLLVTPWLAGGTLGELLARRRRLLTAEAVGVLMTVISAVDSLHRAGWAHGRVIAASVLLASDGTPVLASLGDAAEAGEETKLADFEQLALMAETLLDRPEGIAHLLRSGDLPRASEALSGMAEPRPLSLATSEPVSVHETFEPRERSAFDGLMFESTDTRSSVLSGWLGDAAAASVIDAVLGQARRVLGSVRKQVWIAAGIAAVALLGAVIFIPSPGAGASASAEGGAPWPVGARPTEEPAAGDNPLDDPEVTDPNNAAPEQSASDQKTGSGSESSQSASGSADPLEAAVALLELREGCYSSGSRECLDAVDQPGSAALEMDIAILERVESGAVIPARIDLGDAPFVQRTGDSALVAGPSSSLLLIRDESGWRLRDVFDAPTP